MSKRQIETLLGSWHLELSVGDVGNSGSGSYGQGSVRGGDGGFYGGGASYTIGGGGGSGYLEGVPNFIYVEGTEYKPETQNGVNEGNGRACITFVGTSEYEEKTVNTEYCYDRENKNLLASFSDEGEIVKYVYGNGLISSYTSGDDSAEEPAVSYYLYDLRGSAEHVTDDEGDIVSTYAYSAYGQRTVESGTETPVGYCGRDGVLTEDNGLLYMRARYYAPSLQRFVNQDIVVGDISNSNSLNRYSYVEGNPVTMVDPFGLCAEKGQKVSFWDKTKSKVKDIWNDTCEFVEEHKEAITTVIVCAAGVTVVALVSPLAAPVLIGAGTGAVLNGGFEVLSQIRSRKDEKLDWDKIVTATSCGALSGSLSGSSAGRAVSTVLNSLINVGNTAADIIIDYDRGEEIDERKAVLDIGFSAVMGALAGARGGAGVQNDVYPLRDFTGLNIYSDMPPIEYNMYGTFQAVEKASLKAFISNIAENVKIAVEGFAADEMYQGVTE